MLDRENDSMSKLRTCRLKKYSYLSHTSDLNFTSNSGPALTKLDEKVQRFQQNAFADGTKSNIRTQVDAYLLFCRNYGISSLPATGPNRSRYATWLAASKRAKSVQTVRNYLSAVRTLSKLSGVSCPTPTTEA